MPSSIRTPTVSTVPAGSATSRARRGSWTSTCRSRQAREACDAACASGGQCAPSDALTAPMVKVHKICVENSEGASYERRLRPTVQRTRDLMDEARKNIGARDDNDWHRAMCMSENGTAMCVSE